MDTYLILEVTQNPVFNYFFTLVVAFGVVYLPIAMIIRVITRS